MRARRRARAGGERHLGSEPDALRMIDRLNPASLAGATAEKVIFYRHFAALGLPVPALHGVVGRAGGWSAASGRPVLGEPGIVALLAELPDDVVVKPSAGSHGNGVRVLRREGAALVDLDGRRRDPAALATELLRDPEFELFVVQERLHNHERIRSICPVETLQTVRMTTFAPDAGRVQLAHAYLKLAPRGGNVDNLRGGATGNVMVEVDMATGALEPGGAATGPPGWTPGGRRCRTGPPPASSSAGAPSS
jgi:hypothetical protein